MICDEVLPPIFIINLPDSVERRDHMVRQMSALNCGFEFIEGVNGRNLTHEELKDYDRDLAIKNPIGEDHRDLTAGEIGCAMSHLKIYRKIVAEDIEEAVIIEDDAVLAPEFAQIIRNRRQFPDDWMVVWLGHLSNYLFSVGVVAAFRGRKKIYGKYRLARFVDYPWGGNAYFIKRKAASLLLDFGYPIRMPADLLLTGNHGEIRVPLYGIEPPCAIYDDGQFKSTIHTGGMPTFWKNLKTGTSRGRLIGFLVRHQRLYTFMEHHPQVYSSLKYVFDLARSIQRSPVIMARQLGILKWG